MRFVRPLAGLVLLAAASAASAHVSYAGRDIISNGTFDGVSKYTLAGQRVTSNYGWADAADADWGDSHRGRFLRFTLTAAANVTVDVAAQSGVGSLLGDLVPGFSLYSGVVPHLSHEGSDAPGYVANHPGFLPTSPYFVENGSRVGDKEGAWRSLASFWLGNDAGASAQLLYVGHAFDGNGIDISGDRVTDLVGDGNSDGRVMAQFLLGPGTYSLVVGGASYISQYTEDAATWGANRAFSASITLAPVPEPETWALTAGGLVVLALVRRRRQSLA
jgi:hypothetical protein